MSPGWTAWRSGVAVLCVALAGCADDGNDRVDAAERAVELAAQLRAEQEAADTGDGGSAGDEVDEVAGAPAVEPTGVVVPVAALDNSFRPEVIEIDVGDEVLWENRGLNEHDVLYVGGDDWGVYVADFQPGDVYSHVFRLPGEYRYYCSIHGTEDVGMIGTVIVSG